MVDDWGAIEWTKAEIARIEMGAGLERALAAAGVAGSELRRGGPAILYGKPVIHQLVRIAPAFAMLYRSSEVLYCLSVKYCMRYSYGMF